MKEKMAGKHKMQNGMMMDDAEMKKMMGGKMQPKPMAKGMARKEMYPKGGKKK